ncbi:unnamed protein product [Candida verbasci]|uniref:Uncharacterized protein n=1 Tax=Candida verbasci TaxID=1227364 RepID=A0A9W4TSG2_9ASCO|nr:unnamed protein product [Candida verbasci]
MHLFSSLTQGWVLTIISSLICVLGTFIVTFDNLYDLIFPKSITTKYKFKLKENYQFLNGSLAFSSGCLIFTSLYRLLPESMKYLKYMESEMGKKFLQYYLMISYIGGIILCMLLNILLHYMTAESVVHCNHSGGEHNHNHNHNHNLNFDHDDEESHNHEEHENVTSNIKNINVVNSNRSTNLEVQIPENDQDENSPLVTKQVKPKKSILQFLLNHNQENNDDNGECKGYTSAELCLYHHNNNDNANELHFCEIPTLTEEQNNETEERHHHHHHQDTLKSVNSINSHHHVHHDDEQASHHHHHVNSPLSRLLLIGIQTTLAITLHKLPEGFITYITSETNPNLGISIFISLILHNFTEGFSMCLPLYYSMSKTIKYAKFKAILISSLLGGLSQPLGAILGYFFLKYNNNKQYYDLNKLNFIFGLTLSITSGFLTVVSLSMYGNAVSFGGNTSFVMIWCLIGICLIGLSSIFSS